MRVIFMGTPEFSVPALRAVAARHEVVAVYSQPARAAGRGQRARPSPVAQAAEALGLRVRTPARLRDAAEQALFAALDADVAVVVAYGLILPQPVLDAPRLGCLNIHASILPRWRGAAPIHRAILAGDTETGVAIMQMEAGLDTGPVLAQAGTPIGPSETAAALHDRLSAMGAGLIADVLARLPLPAVPQPEAGVTYAAKIDKAEARIDWTRPAAEVDRRIRALSPFPGAWCLAGGERLKLLASRLAPEDAGDGTAAGMVAAAPGTILAPGPRPRPAAVPAPTPMPTPALVQDVAERDAAAPRGAGPAGPASDDTGWIAAPLTPRPAAVERGLSEQRAARPGDPASDVSRGTAAEADTVPPTAPAQEFAEPGPAAPEAAAPGVTEDDLSERRSAGSGTEAGMTERHASGSGTEGGTGLFIACGTGAVEVTLAQRAGKRPMTPDELSRGWTLPPRLD